MAIHIGGGGQDCNSVLFFGAGCKKSRTRVHWQDLLFKNFSESKRRLRHKRKLRAFPCRLDRYRCLELSTKTKGGEQKNERKETILPEASTPNGGRRSAGGGRQPRLKWGNHLQTGGGGKQKTKTKPNKKGGGDNKNGGETGGRRGGRDQKKKK